MGDTKKLSQEELTEVNGGVSNNIDLSALGSWSWVTVSGVKNYLALRNAPAYDEKNEIAQLHNGDRIQIRNDIKSGAYVWAYASSVNKEGWVNASYVK